MARVSNTIRRNIMDNDDQPIGRVLDRREALKLLGALSAAVLVGCTPGQSSTQTPSPAALLPTTVNPPTLTLAPATALAQATATLAPAPATATTSAVVVPACIVRPELTEGPYFVDEQLDRSDIRSDPGDGSVKEGAPLQLAFRVSQITGNGCTPLAGAYVDIWHCDAAGVYSDVANAVGQKFLRGYQVTDANGLAQFTTIYPGWYPGRAVHIHFKIRNELTAQASYDFTSQLFFDDAFTDDVYTLAPYSSRGARNPRNEGDGIFGQSGDQLTLMVVENESGYAATFDIGLQM
jgi:protocatechuate 3,4-dioxygenase beta subunit